MLNQMVATIQSDGNPVLILQIALSVAIGAIIVWGIRRANKAHDELEDILTQQLQKH